MTNKNRITIAGFMGFVLIASLGLTALRQTSQTWAGLLILVTRGLLALAFIGAVCGKKTERVWWFGFGLFGWSYLNLPFLPSANGPKLPTMALLEALMEKLGAPFPSESSRGFGYEPSPQWVTGHYLWGLLIAPLGGALAYALFKSQDDPSISTETESHEPDRLSRTHWWRRSTAITLSGIVVGVTAIIIGSRQAPALTLGATLLLTWGIIGIAALGTVCNRGRRRTRWLGAALFGAGYMLLIFRSEPYQPSWSHLTVDNFLRELISNLPPVEPGYPASSREVAAANTRIQKALEQPVSVHFPQGTSLEDFLKFILPRARCADGGLIPIYVDPIGLQESEKTMQSPVVLDLEGVPLKTTLLLVLKQLTMTYNIREGLLTITSENCEDLAYQEDPFLPIGQCLIALLAAGLGSLIAPLVADSRRQAT